MMYNSTKFQLSHQGPRVFDESLVEQRYFRTRIIYELMELLDLKKEGLRANQKLNLIEQCLYNNGRLRQGTATYELYEIACLLADDLYSRAQQALGGPGVTVDYGRLNELLEKYGLQNIYSWLNDPEYL